MLESELAPGRRQAVMTALTIVTATGLLLLALDRALGIGLLVGQVLLETQFFYALLALTVPLVFVLRPARQGDRAAWYDWCLFAVGAGVFMYFAWKAEAILLEGWQFLAPPEAVAASFAAWLLVLEAARRAGGLAIAGIAGALSLYPLVADQLPSILAGHTVSLTEAAIYHAMSQESLIGIPFQALATYVVGFLLFGVALQLTGGGRFFIDLAFAALGHVRGGPAKVAILSSAFMGSLSGSAVTNVLTTGPLTIPAMRKAGFPSTYAAGVEACASTGGVLMPPVMGAAAFVMASFLNLPYGAVVVAAIVPSGLYFLGLLAQVDAYAARHGLVGMSREELPSVRQTLRTGWHFLFVLVLLAYMLLYLQREMLAPFVATGLLLVLNQLRPSQRWGWRLLVAFMSRFIQVCAELASILAAVGLLVGALSLTGLSSTLANSLIHLAGGSPMLLLLIGAATSFALGLGMTATAAYVFLAVALAPALVQAGLDPMGAHMFILYWGMLSFITPPVALSAFAAASLAGASPLRTAWASMRLGSVIYVIPFFFALDARLLLQGEPLAVLVAIVCEVTGVVIIAGAIEGYLPLLGRLGGSRYRSWLLRAMLVAAGAALAFPGGVLPLTDGELALAAVLLGVPAVVAARFSQGGLEHARRKCKTPIDSPRETM